MMMERFMKIQEITLIEQEDIRKNQEAYLKRIERYMEQMVQNPAKLGEREGNISLRATEDDSKNNEKAAGLKGKAVMENKEKPTVRGGNQRQQKPQLP